MIINNFFLTFPYTSYCHARPLPSCLPSLSQNLTTTFYNSFPTFPVFLYELHHVSFSCILPCVVTSGDPNSQFVFTLYRSSINNATLPPLPTSGASAEPSSQIPGMFLRRVRHPPAGCLYSVNPAE